MAPDDLLVRTDTSLQEEFLKVIETSTLPTHDGRKVVRVEKLKEWANEDAQRFESLVGEVYCEPHAPALPIRPHEILKASALSVFSILLGMNRGKDIHKFCFNSIDDGRLPISMEEARELFAGAGDEASALEEEANLRAQDFYNRQRAFCPAFFDYPHSKRYKPETILPILEKQIVSRKGGTAEIWQIVVHEEFLKPKLREKLALSRFDRNDGLGPRYNMAMKTFSRENKTYYDTEISAWNVLEHQSGMLQCIGNFEACDRGKAISHNILLEYGQLDLDEYFFHHNFPTFANGIADFWERLTCVAEAVSEMHHFTGPRKDIRTEFCGSHSDIKPDNILLVHGVLKLADPGFARFEPKLVAEKLDRRTPGPPVRGGTTTYGPPECHLGKKDGVDPRAADIWSLGCVFSLAATWLILGSMGICDYEVFRKTTHAKNGASSSGLSGYENLYISQQGDWFHDGDKVLDAVSQWHQYLRQSARRIDSITTKVLDIVDRLMLCSENKRISAESLCETLRKWLVEYRAEMIAQALPTSNVIPGLVQEFLDQNRALAISLVEPNQRNNAVSFTSMLERNEVNPRKTKKTQRFHSPPQSSLDPPAAANSGANAPINAIISEERELPYATIPEGTKLSHFTIAANSPRISRASLSRRGSRNECPRKENIKSQGSDRISPYDAYQLIQTHKHSRNGFASIRGKRPLKDPKIAAHYDDRDVHFLVDNGSSMTDLWSETNFVLEVLFEFVLGQDKDGLDLSFANQHEFNQKGKKKWVEFANVMRRAAPQPEWSTDIRASLDTILEDYLHKMKRSKHKPKKLTIIILTDGLWEGMIDRMDVHDTITGFYTKLRKHMSGSVPSRQVGFQFVQMGDDQQASDLFVDLDDYVQTDEEISQRGKIPDMIDHEHWRGDVRKMLLGSFVKEYDRRDDETRDDNTNGLHLSRASTFGSSSRASTIRTSIYPPRSDPMGKQRESYQ